MRRLPFKALRACKDMSQQDVADKLGVNKMTYANWENYKTYPDALQLIKLSQILDCSLDDFYFPIYTNLKLVNDKDIM